MPLANLNNFFYKQNKYVFFSLDLFSEEAKIHCCFYPPNCSFSNTQPKFYSIYPLQYKLGLQESSVTFQSLDNPHFQAAWKMNKSILPQHWPWICEGGFSGQIFIVAWMKILLLHDACLHWIKKWKGSEHHKAAANKKIQGNTKHVLLLQ